MECFPQNLNIISQILDFSIEVNWSSFPYLGILISLKDLRFYDWQPALDRIKGKITSQGMVKTSRHESFIQVVLSFILVYPCSIIATLVAILQQTCQSILW